MGAIAQMSGPLERVYLHNKKPHTFVHFLETVAALIVKARLRIVSLLSFDPEITVLPIPKKEIEFIIPISEYLQ